MYNCFLSLLRGKPEAIACIKGSRTYPDINGTVYFYQKKCGVMVISEIYGLPKGENDCDNPVFAFHVHDGNNCNDDFSKSGGHFNPLNCPHPHHAGDMPPLFGCNGYAFSAFFTDRFKVCDIVGRVVIIHSDADDFITQPSGNAGEKIACGIIKRV